MDIDEKMKNAIIKYLEASVNTTKNQKKNNKKDTPIQQVKEKKQKDIPEKTYAQIPDTLIKLSKDELKARFGIAKKYSDISGKSITKFYQDNNIKTFKPWHMSYKCKDIIIDTITTKTQLKTTIDNRIKEIQDKLKDLNNLTPTENISEKNISSRKTALTNQLSILQERMK